MAKAYHSTTYSISYAVYTFLTEPDASNTIIFILIIINNDVSMIQIIFVIFAA